MLSFPLSLRILFSSSFLAVLVLVFDSVMILRPRSRDILLSSRSWSRAFDSWHQSLSLGLRSEWQGLTHSRMQQILRKFGEYSKNQIHIPRLLCCGSMDADNSLISCWLFQKNLLHYWFWD